MTPRISLVKIPERLEPVALYHVSVEMADGRVQVTSTGDNALSTRIDALLSPCNQKRLDVAHGEVFIFKDAASVKNIQASIRAETSRDS